MQLIQDEKEEDWQKVSLVASTLRAAKAKLIETKNSWPKTADKQPGVHLTVPCPLPVVSSPPSGNASACAGQNGDLPCMGTIRPMMRWSYLVFPGGWLALRCVLYDACASACIDSGPNYIRLSPLTAEEVSWSQNLARLMLLKYATPGPERLRGSRPASAHLAKRSQAGRNHVPSLRRTLTQEQSMMMK